MHNNDSRLPIPVHNLQTLLLTSQYQSIVPYPHQNKAQIYIRQEDCNLSCQTTLAQVIIHKNRFTATAFYDIHGRDTSGAGWLHWVAVKREYQGKGLSKPLIAYVLNVMKNLGYLHAKIPTQTNTWLACKVYMDFGFMPIKENLEHSYEGWKIVKELTGHSALKDI